MHDVEIRKLFRETSIILEKTKVPKSIPQPIGNKKITLQSVIFLCHYRLCFLILDKR